MRILPPPLPVSHFARILFWLIVQYRYPLLVQSTVNHYTTALALKTHNDLLLRWYDVRSNIECAQRIPSPWLLTVKVGSLCEQYFTPQI